MATPRRGLPLIPLTLVACLLAGGGWVLYESIPRPVAEIPARPGEGPVKVRLMGPETMEIDVAIPPPTPESSTTAAAPLPAATSAQPPTTDAGTRPDAGRWEEEIARYEAAPRPAAGGVVLVGSSNIRMWETLADDLSGFVVVNRGVGGCRLAELADFAPRLIDPASPALIVVSAGSNDIHAGAEPEDVLAAFERFLATVRSRHATVPVVFLGILPAKSRWDERAAQLKANDLVRDAIAALPADGAPVEYLDCGAAFLGTDGLPDPEAFLDDDLHPSAAGNARRAAALRPVLERLLAAGGPHP